MFFRIKTVPILTARISKFCILVIYSLKHYFDISVELADKKPFLTTFCFISFCI